MRRRLFKITDRFTGQSFVRSWPTEGVEYHLNLASYSGRFDIEEIEEESK